MVEIVERLASRPEELVVLCVLGLLLILVMFWNAAARSQGFETLVGSDVLYEKIRCVKCNRVKYVHIKTKQYLDLQCDDCYYGKPQKTALTVNFGVVLVCIVFLWAAVMFAIEYLQEVEQLWIKNFI